MDTDATKKVRSKIRRGELYLSVGEWQTVLAALDYTVSAFAPGHTDLIVLPDTLTKWLGENPPKG